MKVLGIIPARGGSQRVPRKNLADLGGKPLFRWVLDTAIVSGVFTDLWVSTEDEEIGALAGEYWWKRPKELSGHNSPTMEVVRDIFEKVGGDVVATMQPTSPFLTVDDIKDSLKLLLDSNANTITSIIKNTKNTTFR